MTTLKTSVCGDQCRAGVQSTVLSFPPLSQSANDGDA